MRYYKAFAGGTVADGIPELRFEANQDVLVRIKAFRPRVSCVDDKLFRQPSILLNASPEDLF